MKNKIIDYIIEIGAWTGTALFFMLVIKVITEII
jgi:hypothetical protein